MLLAPFQAQMLTPAHAATLAQLADRYGTPWTANLVDTWSGCTGSRYDWWDPQQSGDWLSALPVLCAALVEQSPGGAATARALAARTWLRLCAAAEPMAGELPPSMRSTLSVQFGPPFAAMLASAEAVAAADLRDQVVTFLCRGDGALLDCALAALRAAGTTPAASGTKTEAPAAGATQGEAGTGGSGTRNGSGLDMVARHCIDRLESRLARPVRTADDWSIPLPQGCRCELCTTLSAFLADPARHSYEWPLAEPGRRHVHSRIDQYELPVVHQTR